MLADDCEWSTRTVDSAGASLLVRESRTNGPCVVLLHGLGGYAMEWWPLAIRLIAQCRVVSFDQRGHGDSTRHPDDLSREAFVADVAAVLDAVDAESVVLVGQSMGAHTALLTAARHSDRVRGLVLVEGGVGGGGAEASEDVIDWFRSWPIPFPDAAAAAEYFGGGQTGAVWAAGLEAKPSGLFPRFDADVLHQAILAVHTQERWSEWTNIRLPVLLIKGQNGYLAEDEAQRMLATNNSARFVEVAEAGHDVHLDADEPLAREILEFLATASNCRDPRRRVAICVSADVIRANFDFKYLKFLTSVT